MNADDCSYIQFAPVAYIVKLNIELTMAELISKIVRSSQKPDIKDYSNHLTNRSETQVESFFLESDGKSGKTDVVVAVSDKEYPRESNMKTVATLDDSSSRNSDGESGMV